MTVCVCVHVCVCIHVRACLSGVLYTRPRKMRGIFQTQFKYAQSKFGDATKTGVWYLPLPRVE